MSRTPARADTTNLFKAPPPAEPFRQGEILTFNPATGENTVRVGGAVLTNLPILVGGDTVNFAPGNAVILLKYRSSWAILGRIVSAGNEALTGTAVDFYANTQINVTPTNITNSFQTFASQTIPTPSWANSMLIMSITHAIVANSSGASDSVRMMTDINGGVTFGGETIHQVPDANFQTVVAPLAIELGPGGGAALGASTEIRSRLRCNGATPWPTGAKGVYLNTIATFRRV